MFASGPAESVRFPPDWNDLLRGEDRCGAESAMGTGEGGEEDGLSHPEIYPEGRNGPRTDNSATNLCSQRHTPYRRRRFMLADLNWSYHCPSGFNEVSRILRAAARFSSCTSAENGTTI